LKYAEAADEKLKPVGFRARVNTTGCAALDMFKEAF
jgi:hypothetical protein